MKEKTKLIFQVMGGLLLLILFLFFGLLGMINLQSASMCNYYDGKGYVTYLYWDPISLMCDVPLEYNDGRIVHVDAGNMGDTFVIENYGVGK